jgi:two-component system chemotaxis response regulator CheB
LFRSAAEAFGDRVLAIVLSGNLDDGSDGLRQVAEAGGMTVVQDPNEALHPEMPRNALASAPGSRVARIHDIAGLIKALAAESAEEATMVKEGGGAGESFYFDNPEAELGRADSPGSPTGLSCPECHGVLWFGPDQRSPNLHCRTGHKFTMKTLHNGQRSHVESAMWAAVRALQEEATLARTIAVKAQAGRREGVARRFLLREETARRHAAVLQGLLTEEVPEASWPDP